MLRRSLFLAGSFALLTAPIVSAATAASLEPSVRVAKTAQMGIVQAELSFQEPAQTSALAASKVSSHRLKIVRRGQTLLDQAIAAEVGQVAGDFSLQDLDKTGEPAVVLELPGQTARTYQIYRFDRARNQYRPTRQTAIADRVNRSKIQVTKTSVQNTLTAQLSYQEGDQIEQPTLRLTESGRTVTQQSVTIAGDTAFLGLDGPLIADLDGDKQPEVLLTVATRGAHCCSFSQIYRYDSKQQRYNSLQKAWGNFPAAPLLADVDSDGKPEFISLDDRFSYALGSYAGSVRPPQIWQYRQGALTDVSRSFPTLIREHAAELWQEIQRAEPEILPQILAAYLADQYLLGTGKDGWQRVKQVYRANDRQSYFTKLENFLQALGYMPNAAQARVVRTLRMPFDDYLEAVALSSDGRTLVTSRSGGFLQIWDVESGALQRTIAGPSPDASLRELAISPDGQMVAGTDAESITHVWNLKTGGVRRLSRIPTPSSWSSLSFSRAGDVLRVLDNQEQPVVELWNASTGKRIRSLKRNGGLITAVALSPDGRVLATANSENYTITLWDVISDRPLQTLAGHVDSVFSLAFRADGKTLVSRSSDYSVKAWDLPTGAIRVTLPTDANVVSLSTDKLVLGGTGGGITIWRIQ
ncbi:hypothetical protein H6F43_19565 [Leptolyngbya sp. FACHB-36]|uniref:hypothetical protein n=1 Tax=Leptolyngbya sp. FACHB-36 TaxID=2692808 RepID=UPI001680F479|nr:hypothetical protein [Leptolyngbya sp. FACHB-36]MBD2022383.1 hypothetical protein [Leptolyngbya sp. FACHB-36]